MNAMLYSEKMKGKTVLLTGAGGGIGYEAARVFAAMGARIILAEIQREKGKYAEDAINAAFPNRPASFYEIDLADETQIYAMVDWILRIYGVPDVILNNATIVRIGAVDQVETAIWDKSYAVNFRAPLILTQLYLQNMKERKRGTIVFVSSSGAAPYLGAYEVFKTAQVELSNTLAMELEGSGVFVYTIGPGLVKTETAMQSIEIVAKNMGMTTDEFYNMNNHNILDVEKAGLGFALSAAFSERYHGQEISCNQVLIEFKGLSDYQEEPEPSFETSSDVQKKRECRLASIQETFCKQHAAWQKLNVFERQWVFRDFKKNMGVSAEQADGIFVQLQQKIEQRQRFDLKDRMFFSNLQKYWEHQLKLLRGYEKDESKLKEKEKFITNWINDICEFLTDWPCN
jgi:NAD(P)-dependent dehydrogenase (short-subunit alcohol dehydrogenase family)